MPKRAAHATLERERTRSRIDDDEPAPPAALEECRGVLPLGDDDDLATFDLFRPDGVVSAIDVEGLPDEDAVALGCEAQAMAEGLTLVSSTNACGFKGVSYLGVTKDNRTRRSKPYQVKINDRYVGNFATTAEGALCYARGTAATAAAANTATTSARAKENAPAELPAKVHPLAKRHKLADAVAAATATATRASKGLKASRLDWMAQWLKQSDEEKVHWHSWFEAEMVGGLGYSPSWVSRSG